MKPWNVDPAEGEQIIPDSIPWDKISAPLAAAEDALARLDERLRSSSIAEGWISRTHFQDACASLWLAGELMTLEDLVLHDARMDIRSPTHELTRAQAVLRTRRRRAGLGHERGGPCRPSRRRRTRTGDDPLADELAALDRALERSNQFLAGGPAVTRLVRDPLIYDPDWEDGEKLEIWRRAAATSRSDPPLLAAALFWEAWETNPPLERQVWLGNLLVPALLRERRKTRAHLLCLNSELRHIRREKRRSPDRATRLIAFLEAIAAGAEAGMKDHDRWLLARRSLEGKLKGRRSSYRLPALVDFVMARPMASAGMIAAELGVTPRAAQDMVAEFGLREMTGRGRYRAWGIL